MPLWNIFHPPGAFSPQDKQNIAEGITAIYAMLPRFYVGVVFQEVPKDSFFVGGEAAEDFVRISVDHIARTFDDENLKTRFLGACSRILAPYTTERNLRWEMHVDETPFTLWTIDGLSPPLPDSVEEKRWKGRNEPSRATLPDER